MFEKYLQEIGLNDKEASVYLALLSFENASVLDLAKKTSIKRPTVYTAIESLAKKGLASEATVGKKTHYYAELPDRLETFVEKKILNLEESKKTLKEIIPQLKSLARESGEKPIVKYFEGKEGITSSLDAAVRGFTDTSETMYIIYPKDIIEDVFTSKELEEMRAKRKNKDIKVRAIYSSERDERLSDESSERLRVDNKKYPITSDINIYKDTVLISTLGKRLSAIMIKNKDVADTLKSLFKIVFDSRKS
jgi:HTH-type transcriptional regulator, sugar sensing transcriptional regulator